ncbi:unnamed protein product [Cuscuta europaea]|uniref:Uncharacterized protein n=1 Tax=Cuscuta europaea TaxID=41803 RepID=A0A9P0YQS7_CUSEU|nr:unnamed protein product [Cuscuta europaea]
MEGQFNRKLTSMELLVRPDELCVSGGFSDRNDVKGKMVIGGPI